MNPLKNLDIVKKIISILTTLSVFSFIGCENPVYEDITFPDGGDGNVFVYGDTTESVAEDTLSSVAFSLLSDLDIDGNGFYHLPIDTTKWQTLHRLTGVVTRDSEDLWYVGYDTTYITWFSGFEVPIVNGSSYSDMHGEVNTMIAPVKSMIGDTITIGYSYFDDWKLEETIGEFSIVLD